MMNDSMTGTTTSTTSIVTTTNGSHSNPNNNMMMMMMDDKTNNNHHHNNNNDNVATTKTKEEEMETTYEMLQRWYRALFTKEDYLHHHKILGMMCLLSFISRFILLCFYDDMGFQAFPHLTIPTMVLHTLLTLSSFQFKIPLRRIRDGGRIWPQYRYHSLAFTLRSVCLMALYYYEEQIDHQNHHTVLGSPQSHRTRFYFMNYIIHMGNMGAVELVNYMVGEEQRSNTIRDVEASGYAKFLFSTMQFNIMAIILIGIPYYAIPFYALITIQITPFIGTLRRKSIFNSNFGGKFLYAAMLVGGFVIQSYCYHKAGGEKLHLFGRIIGLYAALLRFSHVIPQELSLLQNKFVIWTIMYMITNHYRSRDYNTLDVVHLRILLVIVLVLLGWTAHHKVQSGYYPKDVKEAKQMKRSNDPKKSQ